jgi:NADPH-dependent 2,4-dienoyl-CoA reductase/sulfur reductase-like enzyme/nitrite reductase/ring-hydroxylating ferredoxin subunit
MNTEQTQPAGPDLSEGVTLSAFVDGKLLGHVGEDEILLVRLGDDVIAVGAQCTHYHGPLADGIVVGDSVRCPWHHACFNLRSGEAEHAPAFDPLPRWRTEQRDGKIYVGEKLESGTKARTKTDGSADKFIIIGGGGAGFAAAEMLRREGFQGSITMLSNDAAPPVDRPNLSKDYLAGSAPEDWLPLRPDDFYAANNIALNLATNVTGIDAAAREVVTDDGQRFSFDRLLLATGAEPVRLSIPGAEQPHVFTLRSLADCRAIIKQAEGARRALVIGASFIGLEAAAALRARDIEVHVVAPEEVPMARILGPEMGAFVRALHEQHGVVFHLGESVTAFEGKHALLKSGARLEADLVVVGIGVRPRLALAEKCGLTLDRGVTVDAFLETSAPGIYAAGDIARWPSAQFGNIRVEHWVVAERQGQTAARNMLGRRERFDAVPFFWSQHYDVPINYVGHAEQWDTIAIEGDITAKDCLLRYKQNGRTLAVASTFRDVASLEAELTMERETA